MKRLALRLMSISLVLVVLCSCAAIQQSMHEAQQQQIADTCNDDAAYASGVNDGRTDQPMRTHYDIDNICPASSRTTLNQAYRKGYQFGLQGQTEGNESGVNIYIGGKGSRHHRYQQQCLKTSSGDVCGYNCIRVRADSAICAATPDQHCIVNTFGESACGYNCVESIKGVRCTRYRGDNCVKNNFGDFKCGRNCRADGISNLSCEEER